MEPVPSTVIKTYPRRGPLQQFRFADGTAFTCFRCGDTKKSKLITVYGGDWSKRLCNGCYGRLLSLYEIKAGTAADDQRAEELASALLSAVARDDQRQAERLFRTSEKRAERLSAEALRFVATAEYVAGQLEAVPQLEWSPAVIGLCKAVEAEIVCRILRPLTAHAPSEDFRAEMIRTSDELQRSVQSRVESHPSWGRLPTSCRRSFTASIGARRARLSAASSSSQRGGRARIGSLMRMDCIVH